MNTIEIITKHDNITKILYKDFIKHYHHPENKCYKDISLYAINVVEAYLEIVGEKYTTHGNEYIDTQCCRYFILTENDKSKFNELYAKTKKLKKKSVVLLMLAGEYIQLTMSESIKTLKFSQIFKNMTEDKLMFNGIDIKWLTKNKFFE